MGAAAVFDNNRLAVIAADKRQGFGKNLDFMSGGIHKANFNINPLSAYSYEYRVAFAQAKREPCPYRHSRELTVIPAAEAGIHFHSQAHHTPAPTGAGVTRLRRPMA